MKHLCTILATVLAAAFSASAKTFDWPIDSPAAGARQFTAYHGETVRFNLQLRGAMTNLSPVAVYYQTNGMGKAEWFGPIPGTVFHPTNDCGAAFYRFFIRCTDPDGVDYTANGSLRLLDSPGFEPSSVQLPAKTLDFSKISVLNPPWENGSAEPGDYAAVSNAAFYASNRVETAIKQIENLPTDTNGIQRVINTNITTGNLATIEQVYSAVDMVVSGVKDEIFADLQKPISSGGIEVAEAAHAGSAEEATTATYATSAGTAETATEADHAADASIAHALEGDREDRYANEIFDQLDAATSAETVTNIVRDLSLGGIWDETMHVWWTPRMRNGSLTYEATTNVNLNAGN